MQQQTTLIAVAAISTSYLDVRELNSAAVSRLSLLLAQLASYDSDAAAANSGTAAISSGSAAANSGSTTADSSFAVANLEC